MFFCKQPIAAIALLAMFTQAANAENWPMWRGPRQDGVAINETPPLSWSATEGVRWKVPLPGQGTSSPIVWDGQVFLTATSRRDHLELHVLSYSLTSGEKLWERRLFGHETALFTQFPPQRGHAMPSAVTDGKRVIALFSTGELAAFDRDGLPLWFHSLQEEFGEIDNDYGLATSPVLAGDQVLLAVDHGRGSYLVAFDADEGQRLWKSDRAGISDNWSTPLLVSRGDKTLTLCAGSGRLEAFELSRGEKVWSVDQLARLCCPMPIPFGDSVIVTSGPGGNVQRLKHDADPKTAPSQLWKSSKGAGFVPSAVCVSDLYFYANDRGILSCLDLANGQELWTQRLEGAFRGSPVAAANRVYFTNLDGRTQIIEAAREYRLLGTGDLAEPISASPAISDGCLLFRTEKHLVCIGNKPAKKP